jgi:hypothetical protein
MERADTSREPSDPVGRGTAVETITCRACRSVNLAGTPRCVNCDAALDVLAPVAVPSTQEPPSAPPIPPTPRMPTGNVSSPPLPPPVDLGSSGPFPSEPRRRTSRYAVALIGLVLVLVVVAIAAVANGGSPQGVPDQVAGLTKLDTPETDEFERSVSSIEIMDMRIEGAIYGEQDQPRLMLEVFRNLPPGSEGVSAASFFSGATGGFEGRSGAAVDESRMVQRTVGSVDVACAPVDLGSSQVPNIFGSRAAALCVWTGSTYGLLLDARLHADAMNQAIDEVVALQPGLS